MFLSIVSYKFYCLQPRHVFNLSKVVPTHVENMRAELAKLNSLRGTLSFFLNRDAVYLSWYDSTC